MDEIEQEVTDQDLLVAVVEQLKMVKYLLAALLTVAVIWSVWFVMNRADQNAEREAVERVLCLQLDLDC